MPADGQQQCGDAGADEASVLISEVSLSWDLAENPSMDLAFSIEVAEGLQRRNA